MFMNGGGPQIRGFMFCADELQRGLKLQEETESSPTGRLGHKRIRAMIGGISNDFSDWLGESKLIHTAKSFIPPSQFSSTSSNGL